jgi:membrane protease YdiL (CAAX protease family)
MSFIRRAFQTMHPAAQVVLLSCIVLTFMALAAGVGVVWVSGGEASLMQEVLAAGQTGSLDRSAVLAMNNANQLLAFLGASIAFAGLVGSRFLGRFFLGVPSLGMGLLAVLVALGMSPLLDLTYRLNEWALVPGSDFHTWAGSLEDQAKVMTQSLLSFETTSDVWPVLLSVALLPAVCEEFLFRGTLQPLLVRATGNLHFGIWVSAALFSAIHLQFFGFVPRMLLGAAFGYLVAYSGSLWPAVLGHFVNNAGVVVAAWWMGSEWLNEGLEPQPLASWELGDWVHTVVALSVLGWAMARMFARGNTANYLAELSPAATPSEQTPQQS